MSIGLSQTIIPSYVQTIHVTGGYTIATAKAPSAASTTWEGIVVDVVTTADKGKLHIVCVSADIGLCGIAVFCTIAHVSIDEPAFLHTFLHGQVEYGLLIAIVDTCDTAVVALFVVRLNLFNHLRGDILHSHLGVVVEEFLTTYHDFRHSLTVNLNGTVFAHLCTRQLPYQFFQI